MGVPQRRERVFFYAIRKDLYNGHFADLFSTEPLIDLNFNEKEIPYKEIEHNNIDQENITHVPTGILPYLRKIKEGRSCADVHPKGSFFQELKLHRDNPLPTLRASSNKYYHYEKERRLYDIEIILGSSFPMDYDFLDNKPIYLCGMSVPPLMVARLSDEIFKQWIEI